MTGQTFIQVRIDSQLKKEATDILNELGIDMPNAIRMFLRRIVLERGIPFDTKLPVMQGKTGIDRHIMDGGKSVVIYTPANTAKNIPMQEYIDLLCKVPAGKITRLVDIEHYLEKRYNVSHVQIEFAANFANPLWDGIPLMARGLDTRYVAGHKALRP